MRDTPHRRRHSNFPQFALRHAFYFATAFSFLSVYIAWRTRTLDDNARWQVVTSLGSALAIYLAVVVSGLGLYVLRAKQAGTLVAMGSLHARGWVLVHTLNIIYILGFALLVIVESGRARQQFAPLSFFIFLLPVLIGARSITYFAQHHVQISTRGLVINNYLPWSHFRKHYWREREQLELHLLPTIGWQLKVFIDPNDRVAVQKLLDDASLPASVSRELV